MRTAVCLLSLGAVISSASIIPARSLSHTFQERQIKDVCMGATGNSLCCATDVLQLADLDCKPPSQKATSYAQFLSLCTRDGQQAKCCALPILGQALFCQDPVKDASAQGKRGNLQY